MPRMIPPAPLHGADEDCHMAGAVSCRNVCETDEMARMEEFGLTRIGAVSVVETAWQALELARGLRGPKHGRETIWRAIGRAGRALSLYRIAAFDNDWQTGRTRAGP
jgi:hypothetical protein